MTVSRYHHGNLRLALLDAGLRTARLRGPNALQLRDLAATQGVSPSAVYRHFPDLAHLAADVSRLAREQLARHLMRAADAQPADSTPGTRSIQRFGAIGRAYVDFAVREPHLFDTAFLVADAPPSCEDDPSAWAVLNEALDDLVATGELAASRRGDATMIAWSSVHGLAGILARGMLPPPHEAHHEIEATCRGTLRALGVRDVAPVPLGSTEIS
jgi:AcrR family transcriptional regulator